MKSIRWLLQLSELLLNIWQFQLLEKYLKKTSKKIPTSVTNLLSLFLPKCRIKGLCCTQKVFQLAECSEIKGVNLSADFPSGRPFLLITEKHEDKCHKREMSCVDFCYMECSVFLCWLALTHCFFSENDVEKKFCPGLGMEL